MTTITTTEKTRNTNSVLAPRQLAGLAIAFPLLLTGCTSTSSQQLEPLTAPIQLGASSQLPESPSPSATVSLTESASASPTATPTPSQSATEPSLIFDRRAEIDIEDQTGSGKTLVIDEFEVGIDNLWLVIRDESGRVIDTELTNTSFKPVTLTLNRAITKSQELVATLYLDDGDGVFDSGKDSPVYEEPGELVEEDFEYSIG